jgi:formiminoglutamase
VFSIGTNDGQTCAPSLRLFRYPVLRQAFDAVLNGRFKGGWTTRHYGQPGTGVHAIQMELAQRAYLAAEAAPWTYAPGSPRHCARFLGKFYNPLTPLPARACSPMKEPSMLDRKNSRDIYPATGTEITAKSWQTEAPRCGC